MLFIFCNLILLFSIGLITDAINNIIITNIIIIIIIIIIVKNSSTGPSVKNKIYY